MPGTDLERSKAPRIASESALVLPNEFPATLHVECIPNNRQNQTYSFRNEPSSPLLLRSSRDIFVFLLQLPPTSSHLGMTQRMKKKRS